MPVKQFSLITICYNRNKHLINLLNGIEKSTEKPDEVIIVDIDHSISIDQTAYSFDIDVVDLPKAGNSVPLANARNFGATKANFSNLIFLDVDCIPSEGFIAKIKKYLNQTESLVMGEPYYLGEPIAKHGFNSTWLEENSIPHPHRPILEVPLLKSEGYELFWSLCFGIPRASFERIGGFDTNYAGYGGEDTDFAFEARANKVPFYLSTARVYHQQHPVYSPPVNHFAEIVANSNTFYSKWKAWPMGGWLTDFKEMGLLEWEESSTIPIRILKEPNSSLLAECYQEFAPFS